MSRDYGNNDNRQNGLDIIPELLKMYVQVICHLKENLVDFIFSIENCSETHTGKKV